jgi:hypothetical protein
LRLLGHRVWLEIDWRGFDSLNHLLAGLLGEFTNLHPLQDGCSGIRAFSESSGSLKNRTEALSLHNPVAAGMLDLAVYCHRRTNVLPAGQPPNADDIAGF